VSLTPVKLCKKNPSRTVIDNVEEFLIGVNDTGKENFTGFVDTCEAPRLSNNSTDMERNRNHFLEILLDQRELLDEKNRR
jgi:hypothetical protein